MWKVEFDFTDGHSKDHKVSVILHDEEVARYVYNAIALYSGRTPRMLRQDWVIERGE